MTATKDPRVLNRGQLGYAYRALCSDDPRHVNAVFAHIDALTEALEFYEEPENWIAPVAKLRVGPEQTRIDADAGKRARRALGIEDGR